MNIPLSRFWAELATVLPDIASARFVAFDFEMTGIEPRNAPPLQRPTKEQLYERARQATEMFNVLQFGLTCISYKAAAADAKERDGKNGTFHLKSYNFNVSPMFDTHASAGAVLARVLDRTLTLSYKTLMFLSKNRIRIEDAYDGGIPYLSRTEEWQAVDEMFGTNQRPETQLVDIDKTQEETKQFYVEVADNIRKWESDKSSDSYLNIRNPHNGPMTRFQRRLVYQILEIEFKRKYRAVVKENYFMQITKRDGEVEEKGLTQVPFVKLAGEPFADDVYQLYDLNGGIVDTFIRDKLKSSEAKLQTERPILVGHNMFLDLCFLYATFFAPLPDTLDSFGQAIHKVFPRILDTKHILTYADHEMMAPKILDDMFLELEKKDAPFAIEHSQTRAAHKTPLVNAHQAGHDSYKTSVVFLHEMWKHVGMDDFCPLEKENGDSDTPMVWESPSTQQFANKIRIGNAGIWNLGADDTLPNDGAGHNEETV
ncbi:hypothetical protein SCUCBS95973_001709 [Sporothrix curviconia]|uniref:Uncharacterized protein n=1 Tax=Sporothrix curviconia TaxID=1260050 RepID=A0ABP0B0X3_9PEZI